MQGWPTPASSLRRSIASPLLRTMSERSWLGLGKSGRPRDVCWGIDAVRHFPCLDIVELNQPVLAGCQRYRSSDRRRKRTGWKVHRATRRDAESTAGERIV
ncbi:hypothetical protein BAUCODRAFT_143959 [Baudoinia panamericana UAMH 10762]|uniref:Uncharacterized protein n=1 Tax=Baudoinia panamericana (strain UAMH 10762) TaxID=717646 RepID=M2M357_BAUPA|nr:uncharacterized protein BAUCODRAFT_143959 [Baudoinia panamericana UAMH 10762]EMC90971.1 hypothetical protein BAUCODRAFT_143959 [Baudoinia panamericana UAMH 10762]